MHLWVAKMFSIISWLHKLSWFFWVRFSVFHPRPDVFCSHTCFAIVKNLTIICMNKLLKSNMQVSSSLHQAHGAKKCLMDYQIYVVNHLCRQMDISLCVKFGAHLNIRYWFSVGLSKVLMTSCEYWIHRTTITLILFWGIVAVLKLIS